jgi:hypothetical protein
MAASVGQQFMTVWQAPIPFILVVAIVALAIWRAMEWRYRGTIERLADEVDYLRRKLEHAEPPAVAEAELIKQKRLAQKEERLAAPKERVFVPDNVTPRYLTDFWRENTKLQAERVTGHFNGKWIKVMGKLHDVEKRSEFYYVNIQQDQQLDKNTIAHDQILLVFRDHIEGLEMLQRGSVISAVGWIQGIDNHGLTLEDCELV